jgi:hypothetical protein
MSVAKGQRSASYVYSGLAIECTALIRAVYHFPLQSPKAF